MSSYRGCNAKESQDSKLKERFIGKVQYLRPEHGYIRSKSKIHGVRDVTFNFSDVTGLSQIEVGDIVSFRVSVFSSGKFCAVDVQIGEDSMLIPSRSESPVSSISSIDNYTVESKSKGSSLESSPDLKPTGNPSEKFAICSWNLKADNSKVYPNCDDARPFYIPSFSFSEEPKMNPAVDEFQFSRDVDIFLDKVISRSFCSSVSTCWLQA